MGMYRLVEKFSNAFKISCSYFAFIINHFLKIFVLAGNSQRGMRVSSYDPDDPTHGGGGQNQGHIARPHAVLSSSQRVATISQNYNEKTMLLSSDDELQ